MSEKLWKNYSQQARAKLGPTVDNGTALCHKCGLLVTPGQRWDIDHIEARDIAPQRIADPTNWAIAHRYCNRAAGARYGLAKRGIITGPRKLPKPSREW